MFAVGARPCGKYPFWNYLESDGKVAVHYADDKWEYVENIGNAFNHLVRTGFRPEETRDVFEHARHAAQEAACSASHALWVNMLKHYLVGGGTVTSWC